MKTRHSRALRITGAMAATTLLISACGSADDGDGDSSSASGESIKVEITEDACEVASDSAKSGPTTFELDNDGEIRSEFEILAEDKLRVIGERETLEPGSTTEYVVDLKPGEYFTACKPNMMGEPIGLAAFTVTDSGIAPALDEDRDAAAMKANEGYVSYVRSQVSELLTKTKAFTKPFVAMKDDEARELYPLARQHYERIESNVEPWVELDIALDYRQVNAEEENLDWTGWHVAEKDLWAGYHDRKLTDVAKDGYQGYQKLTKKQRKKLAEKLNADTQKLYDLVYADEFAESTQIAEIANGAQGLLEEVAGGKITGEEELWSQTDLYDFEANVQGAEVAYGYVKDLAGEADAESVHQIDAAFAKMYQVLGQHGSIEVSYPSYSDLSNKQVKELSDTLNALRKAIGGLTANVLS